MYCGLGAGLRCHRRLRLAGSLEGGGLPGIRGGDTKST